MRLAILFLFLSFSFSSLAKPKVYFNYKIYYTDQGKPYISNSLQLLAGTFKYQSDSSGNLFAKVQITQIFTRNDSVIIADKYILNSPLMADSIVDDFYDVQRYQLAAGYYDYELEIQDLLSGEIINGQQEIKISRNKANKIFFSDIEFLEDVYPTDESTNFSRNGLFMLPYLTDYFPPDVTKLALYTEAYNTKDILGEGAEFIVTTSVHDAITYVEMEDIFAFQRLKAADVNPIISVLPLETLPSGKYYISMQIINSSNDTVAYTTIPFQRRNDAVFAQSLSIEDLQIDKSFETELAYDSIPYFLASLMPISERYERDNINSILKSDDTTYMAKYLYSYWLKTSPVEPYLAWLRYKDQVKYVENMFGTQIKSGFETDRGRTHLKYGPPNAMVDRPNEPSAYPYQIWHYYRIGQRSDIKFIFYNPDLVTNDYPMLHSDMQGELQNYRWKNDLHKRNSTATDVDDPGSVDHYGGQSDVFFRNGGM
jgi:GWxTD domain-containing protein